MYFEFQDVFIVGLLVFLEGILSIDNALVLAILVKPLPKELRRKALTYGIAGAIVFRIIAISFAAFLLKWIWVKFLGGAYLIFVAAKHLWEHRKQAPLDMKKPLSQARTFWGTVLVIELTDIAFAVDSILAAVALTPKLILIYTGGIIGLVMMRFAATLFVQLLEQFPHLELSAYLLVLTIGIKLILEGFQLPFISFHSLSYVSFWIFWAMVAFCIALGFRKKSYKLP